MKLRLLASVILAGMVSGCSSDVARFGGNPFQNPFTSRTSFDPASTASVNRSATPVAPRPQPVSVSAASSQRLPAPSQPMLAASPAAPTYRAPGPISTGSVASAAYPPLVPVAPRPTTALGGSQGWTAIGGTPVTLKSGETLNTLSDRYGVPVSALLAVNGLSSAQAARPGQSILIPAFNPAQVAQADVVRQAGTGVPLSDAPKMLPPRAEPVRAAPVGTTPPRPAAREVGQRTETEAEKRAAAKLKQLRQQDEEADDTPVRSARPPVKTAAPDKAAIEKAQPEKARAEAQRKREAEIKAEAEKKREATARLNMPRKPAPEDMTASIPEPKAAARPAPVAAKPPVEEPEVASTAFRWPAQGRVINGYGGRSASGPNDGINIAVPEGTPVRAAEAGTVIHADDALKGYGKLVLVRHANGLVTVYAHNSDIKVKRGENVRRGQVIAASGSTGNVTSPQLHFQIRQGSQPVDPMKHLAAN